ncbi:MAG TPA: hypothetical protein VL354_19560 [Spirochaetia bacterium]|nr:hypothetical protein [Spirochaetia bacterium]
MVKTRFLFLVGCVFLFAGCGLLGRSERANPEVLQIAHGRLGNEASLVQSGDSLVAVYSDWETTGLYDVVLPISDRLPTVAPAPTMIDKIDMALPLSSSFGEHVAAVCGNTTTVMYLVRASEDKMILKVATRDAGEPAWTVDALERPGDPVAILPVGPDRMELFWAAGSLLHVTYPGAGQAESLMEPFVLEERGATFGASPGADSSAFFADRQTLQGVSAYNSALHSLFLFRWNGSTYDPVKINGAGPVHSSLLLSDGSVAVLSWDPATRRLELVVQGPGESRLSQSLVTMSNGTSKVALLPQGESSGHSTGSRPAATSDHLLFLYDEARLLGGGRVLYELCLLTPGSGWGPVARKYRKLILASGAEPIVDFSALETNGRLYVLVHQDGLKLLGLKLPR